MYLFNMENPTRAHMLVSGRVQGVFFRENTRKIANELEVFGWVRNLLDGRVEVVAEGEKEKVKRLVEWAKEGPPSANVESLDLKWKKYQGDFDEFEVKY